MSTVNLPTSNVLTDAITGRSRHGMFNRMAAWFRRSGNAGAGEAHRAPDTAGRSGDATVDEPQEALREAAPRPRLAFLRVPSRRKPAIDAVQQELSSLNTLLSSIRDSLREQVGRQELMLTQIGSIADVLRDVPSIQKEHGATLATISDEISQQVASQGNMAAILDRLSEADGRQASTLEALCGHEAAVRENVAEVRKVVKTLNANAFGGTRALQSMVTEMSNRHRQMEDMIHQQTARISAMVTISIGLSVTSIVSVAMLACTLMYHFGK